MSKSSKPTQSDSAPSRAQGQFTAATVAKRKGVLKNIVSQTRHIVESTSSALQQLGDLIRRLRSEARENKRKMHGAQKACKSNITSAIRTAIQRLEEQCHGHHAPDHSRKSMRDNQQNNSRRCRRRPLSYN